MDELTILGASGGPDYDDRIVVGMADAHADIQR
jgi:hypothetical protein